MFKFTREAVQSCPFDQAESAENRVLFSRCALRTLDDDGTGGQAARAASRSSMSLDVGKDRLFLETGSGDALGASSALNPYYY
ncbi:hypothetical protein CVT26_004802 [Gymnopilus dilepis]|uniref:Uncharacterized protein n=1 Tax=Gymnopilus dilepis TaxID=231916 RepID=A0A409XZM0_9AGAR|nr:hypothetical protein CVT26_004802 [Gymnopilus dilepis]